VIRSFASSATRRLYELGKLSGFGGLDVAAAQELLAILDAATNLNELGAFRNSDAFNVEIVDYHRG